MVILKGKQEHSIARRKALCNTERLAGMGWMTRNQATSNNHRSTRLPLMEGWPALVAPGP